MKGKIWCVIKTMYNSSRSAVLLEGEKFSTYSVEQGVAQGYSLSPILFSVFISDLLKEIDRAQIGIQLKSGNKVGGLLFTHPTLQDAIKYQAHILYVTRTCNMMVPCTYPTLQDTMKYQAHILYLTSTRHMMAPCT